MGDWLRGRAHPSHGWGRRFKSCIAHHCVYRRGAHMGSSPFLFGASSGEMHGGKPRFFVVRAVLSARFGCAVALLRRLLMGELCGCVRFCNVRPRKWARIADMRGLCQSPSGRLLPCREKDTGQRLASHSKLVLSGPTVARKPRTLEDRALFPGTVLQNRAHSKSLASTMAWHCHW